MKLKTFSHEFPTMERVFKIKRINNIIDLRDSFSIIEQQFSTTSFEAEIFKVTFSVTIDSTERTCDLFLSCNELISDYEIEVLNRELGIEVSGDGALFQIISYKTAFKIQFDKENSHFIDTENVKDGLVVFKSPTLELA